MATYIGLLKYTQQGIKDVKGGPARLDAAKKAYAAAGGAIKAFYLTMGRYDLVVVAELPDDTAAAKLALQIGSLGNITSETLRAFSEDEFRTIINSLS